ncbi:MAG: hypothetical protein JWN91_787 [Nocardioides sp.]|jgi:predicted DNA repair protein MutK|nr:hypothetical protein [Nocardioides sp.]
MSVQASSSRPATKSIGAAVVDLILTLVILVVTFLAFLIAPLLALGVAYLCYAAMRPRAKKRTGSAPHATASDTATHGFGAGTA